MSDYNFKLPSRQSSKGIIVIFGKNIFKFIKNAILIFAAFFVSFKGSYDTKIIYGIVLLFLFFIIFSILKYLNFKFHITTDYFVLNQGILNKEKISIAKNKIQNVYIKQNILQQLINVVSLSIESAGDKKTEVEIQALSVSKANALKELLLENKTVETIDEVKEKEPTVYFKASIKKLILEGISENHLKSFIIILIFLIGIYKDFKDFLMSFKTETRFDAYFEFNETELLSVMIFNFVLVFLLLFAAFLFSVIKIFTENYDLKVIKKENGLEISKGLFNKINLGLTPSRIQNTDIKTNRFKQWLGLYKLNFTQAMVNKKQQKHFAIIGLNKLQVNELVDKFYPKVFLSLVKLKPEKFFIYSSIVVYALIFLVLNIIFSFISFKLFLINIPLLIFSVLSIIYSYKKAYYSIDDKYLVVGSGKFIDTYTSFLELHKVQSVSFEQTIFQKRRGLASVIVYSSAKELYISHIKETNAKSIIDYLLFKIESSKKDWM